MPDANAKVVERFYHEIWSAWDLAVSDEILTEDVRFRGTLGSRLEGREAFKHYDETIREAFSDWDNQIDEAISCRDRVLTRMTWSGTHEGTFMDIEPTGVRVEYVGADIFRLSEGKIVEAWVRGEHPGEARVSERSTAQSKTTG